MGRNCIFPRSNAVVARDVDGAKMGNLALTLSIDEDSGECVARTPSKVQ